MRHTYFGCFVTLPRMREMSVTEQRYKAVLAVIGDGRTVSEVATDWGVSRRTMHRWLVRYEADGLEGLNNRSHRPAQSPRQMPPAVEAMVLEMRRSHPYWGARPAGQRRQTLRWQRLRCARDGRPASVLGRQRATQDRGSDQHGECPQAACRRHGAPE